MFETQANLPGAWAVLGIAVVVVAGGFWARKSIKGASHLAVFLDLLRPVRECLRTDLIIFENRE